VLCPNHHALCDLRAIHIRLDEIRLHRDHKLSEEFVEYHNALVLGTEGGAGVFRDLHKR
jgi:hypothetical protein